MKTRSWLLLTAMALATPPVSAAANGRGIEGPVSGGETLRFTWRIEGLAGGLGRLFGWFPCSGDGVLQALTGGQGQLLSEFRATARDRGESWTYRAELDLRRSMTLRVWDRLVYRGREREKSYELAAPQVIDFLSALQMLRKSPPAGPRRESMWSDGRVFPVLVTPRGAVTREIDGRRIALLHYSIRGVREPSQPFWKARAEIWLTDDARAVPVEILLHGRRGRIRVAVTDLERSGPVRVVEMPRASGSAPG